MAGIGARRHKFQQEWMEKTEQLEWKGDITMDEVRQHNTREDLWVIYGGFVYDITKYIQNHPAGPNCFLNLPDQDMTSAFNRIHRQSDISIVEKLKIGKLVG
jgi:cytochrome b involved in lipid metabolism